MQLVQRAGDVTNDWYRKNCSRVIISGSGHYLALGLHKPSLAFMPLNPIANLVLE